MEWLYDTLAESPSEERPSPGRRFPTGTVLALLLGIVVVAGLLWLLIGPSPLRTGSLLAGDATPTRLILPLVEAVPHPATSRWASPLQTPTATPTPAAAFEIGARVVITGTGSRGLRIRAGAGLDYLTQEIYQDGDAFFVMPSSDPDAEYPVQVDGYTWWRLRAADGLIGWTVEDFLVPAPLLTETPTPAS